VVPAHKTRGELVGLIVQHGAEAVAQFQETTGGVERSAVAFRIHGVSFRFQVLTPPLSDFRFAGKTRRYRDDQQATAARDQAHRQRWRSLLLFVRAAIEAAEQGATTIVEALLPWVVTPSNRTIGEDLVPRLLAGAELDPRYLLPPPSDDPRSRDAEG
jgi:hypothetical protein